MVQRDGPAVLALVGDTQGSTLYRVFWPFTYLAQQGYPAYWCPRDDDDAPRVAQGWNPAGRPCDAVVLPRLYWQPQDADFAAQWIGDLQANGHAVISEWDDDVMTEACLGQMHLLRPAWERAQLEADRAARIQVLGLADGVTVSTPHLAAVVRQYVRPEVPVVVVPNALDWAWFRRVSQAVPRSTSALTIGWAGGQRVEADLAPMATAWARLAARYPAVQFQVIGFHAPILVDAVPAAQLQRVPWHPLETYPQAYRDLDIACAPLAPTAFNRSKSICKALEYGAVGAAVVASPWVYGQELRDGRDALIAQTADEWEAALGRLIAQPTYRHALARRWARRVQARYTVAQTAAQWVAAWRTVVASYRARRPRLVAV